MKFILENIIENFDIDNFSDSWILPELGNFSEKKKLYDYQKNALESAIKTLHLYFEESNNWQKGENEGENKKRKRDLYYSYKKNGLNEEEFDKGKKDVFFDFYNQYFNSEYDKISFSNFINRISFFMATGSGKSLVIIKIIELLDFLIRNEEIPNNDIMLLAPKEDLLNQIKVLVNEYNQFRNRKIELISLKDYEKEKFGNFNFGNTIKVYYYRSDNFSDSRKEKMIDFKSYDNDGNWYILLDEAHKGKKEDSKRQSYFSILARNGFLFNFSATFTEKEDIITTGFNFNLEKFIKSGYGKHIFLTQKEFSFFDSKEEDDFTNKEKQKIVLKSLLNFVIVKKSKEKIDRIKKGLYHNPLIITLVNSVNTDKSDLILFFKEIEKIAENKIDKKLFNEVKKQLKNEFNNKSNYIFEDEFLKIDLDLIDKLELEDLLKYVFNSKKSGKIEVILGKENNKELVLKLKTAETPFALIKIGDTSHLIKDKLIDYEYNQTLRDKSFFEELENDPNINILMGSRSFYEGWDSNRPNILNYINIGKGEEAKKFVLQSLGRGIRIQPKDNERKRAKNLYNSQKFDIFPKISNDVAPIETLFVYGTNKDTLKKVIESVKEFKKKFNNIKEIKLEKNKINFDLLIPVYKEGRKFEGLSKLKISKETLNRFKEYINNTENCILVIRDNLNLKEINFIKNNLESEGIFDIDEKFNYNNLELFKNKIISHIRVYFEKFDNLKKLENEIIHFEKIITTGFSDEEIYLFKNKIDNVLRFKNKNFINEDKLLDEFKEGKITKEELKEKQNLINRAIDDDEFKNLKIKYIEKHYYLPVIYTKEKSDYIKHIIKNKSEYDFIENLINYLKSSKIDCDNWMFSKIDESLDKIYIPYFDKSNNKKRKFFPDFIFWIQKGNNYKIVFVDPKGTEYTSFLSKIDEGYKKLFENKKFNFKNYKISIDLKLVAEDKNKIKGEEYKKYWLDKIDDIFVFEE
jgi:superfamily II DNA or RNA helicase